MIPAPRSGHGTLHEGERRSTLVYWPTRVDERLDFLVRLIVENGGQASRAQVLAALVAAAPLDGVKLDRRLRAYRRRDEESFTVEHTREPSPRSSRRRPGPRTRTTHFEQDG